MTSQKNIDFEWDLSKENVRPLSTGRSVPQLNMVLAFQKSPIFTRWCDKIRKQFDNALQVCPSELKIQLYGKYIRWIEDFYPSLGAASKYRNVLYRCVKDTCYIQGIHNHPIYVDAWLKLINYCDSASELFNLLFHNGVGTLNTEFYLAWTDHLKQLPERPSDTQAKRWSRIASIFAHGLRAGAKPHYLLEDRAECFVASVKRSERLAEEKRGFEKLVADQQRKEKAEEERQTLGELRTFEGGDGRPLVPKVRTGSAINPERQGLRGLRPRLQDAPAAQKPRPGLQILQDPVAPSDLPNLAGVQPISGSTAAIGKTLSRLVEPVASWNVENVKAPSVRLDRKTAMTFASISTSRAPPAGPPEQPHQRLAIFKDAPEETAKSTEPPNRPALSMAASSRRGLRLAASSGQCECGLRNPGDHIFSLENLQSALLGTKTAKQGEEEVNLEFFCDIDALSSLGYETNFEMNRELEMLKSSTSSVPSEEDKKKMECFSLNLDDQISKTIVGDIENIVAGVFEEPEDCLSESELAAEKSDCTKLIKQLEAIVTKYDAK